MNEQKFRIEWSDLTYKIRSGGFFTSQRVKTVLSGLSGQLESGHVTAILGPSGAGKSCFLRALSGADRNQTTGNVQYIRANKDSEDEKESGDRDKKMSLASIPQSDQLFNEFSVYETLEYSSKFKDDLNSEKSHRVRINEVIDSLGLQDCANTRVAKISGGQRKRLSIGCELITPTDFLIIDEPTSGLDSLAALDLVELLKKLAVERNMAILITIHTPSAKVFKLLDQVYVMSPRETGGYIYAGNPNSMLTHFKDRFNLSLPTVDSNPADWVMSLACGELPGIDLSNIVSYYDKQEPKTFSATENGQPLWELVCGAAAPRRQLINFNHIWLHTEREFLRYFRDTTFIILNFGLTFGLLFTIVTLSGRGAGRHLGCPLVINSVPRNLTEFSDLAQRVRTARLAAENIKLNLLGLIFVVVTIFVTEGVPFVATLPKTFGIVRREVKNGWYSPVAWYLGSSLAQVPICMLIPCVMVLLYNPLAELDLDWPATFTELLIFCARSLLQQSFAELLAALLVLANAASYGPQSVILFSYFIEFGSGLFGDSQDHLSGFKKFLNFVSFDTYTIKAYVAVVFGNRCGPGPGPIGNNPKNPTHDESFLNYLAQYHNIPTGNGPDAYRNMLENIFYDPVCVRWSSGDREQDLTAGLYDSVAMTRFKVSAGDEWNNIAILCGITICLKIMAAALFFIKIVK